MELSTKHYTVEEFEQFTELPENADRLFEFIGGEIIEVPSNPYASEISFTIGFFIKLFVRENNLEGHVTGEAGGYMVSGERYAPDVAFISKDKPLAKQGYNPLPPDLAVEVDFPSTYESQQTLITEIPNYLAAGTTVWLTLPETKQVKVYAPGQPVKILNIDDTLDGGNVLPGFTLPLQEIFPK